MKYLNLDSAKLTEEQVSNILNKVVPLIAEPKDYEFFRGVLGCYAETLNAANFGYMVSKLLKETP